MVAGEYPTPASSPQRISGVYNVGGGPHLGSGLTIDTAAKILRDTT